MNNVLAYLGTALQIISAILAAAGSFQSGQPTTVPQIRTYIGKQHVAIDVTVTPIP